MMNLYLSAAEYDYHTLLKVAEMAGLAGIIGFHEAGDGYADRQRRANKLPRIQPEKDVFVVVADFFRYFDFDKSHLP